MEEPTTDIEVTVKTLDSQSRSYTVGGQLTVKDFKEHIAPSVGIPVDKQRLIYQGRVLQDERTLTEYNVSGKVIHLVERAPPQPSQPDSGSSGVSGSAENGGPSSTNSQGTSQVPPHDRNANSYVMLGTFNLPVNIMDPQQIQMSVQQMMSGMGENARVTTSTGSNGSMNVHIDMDQAVQSEPRLRLLLAENLLRDTNALIQRMEGEPEGASTQPESVSAPPAPSSSTTSTPSPSAQPMDTSPPASTPPPSSTSATQTETAPPAGVNHPSPAELVEMLSELRRVEERLQPFIQRAHTIMETATNAEYSTNEHEEDQRILNLVGEALRHLGNALVALSDLRCNLLSPAPRHLHVVRPMSHYTGPVPLPGAVHHHHIPLHMNMGATVSVSANGRQATEGQAPPTQPTGQSAQAGQGQTPPSQPPLSNQQAGQGQVGPRVIRISHQAVPVVMMQMNADEVGNVPQAVHQQIPGQPGAVPPDFMRNIMQQIGQYAAAMATGAGQPAPPGSASTTTSSTTTTGPNTPTTTPTAPPPPPPTGTQPQARVVFTRPAFAPGMPPPVFGPRGTTFNVRTAMPGQQPGQPFPPAALNQMISGLVGQLLMPGQMTSQTDHVSSSNSSSASYSFSTSTGPGPATSAPPSGTPTAPTQPGASPAQLQPQAMPADLSQLLGSLLGGAAGAGGMGGMGATVGPGGAPSITVTMPGVPAFIQGVSDFMQQASQPAFPPPPYSQAPASSPAPGPAPTPPLGTTSGPTPPPGPAPGEALNPELFTGIVQSVLSTMMGSLGQAQNDTESIAQFMLRLSQNLFISPEDPTGFFGELLTLVCQTFTMSDLVMLLHGQHQPLGRIQPQLSQFFTQNYLNGQEPTDQNITAAAESIVTELEEYISESFRESSVIVLEGVDITQTNMSFFRQQLACIATHILRCSDQTFGPRLLQLCNQGLFECLALNLHCLRGDQAAITAVINHRIRRMSSDMSPSLVNWMTSMMTMRLQVILEHIPVTQEQIRHYIVHTQRELATTTGAQEQSVQQQADRQSVKIEDTHSPAPATTAEEALSSSRETRASFTERGATGGAAPLGGAMPATVAEAGRGESARDSDAWAAAVPPEWVPIIRHDLITQRKIKAQPPMSDAYLHGMPAKRRKTGQGEGALLSLSDAVSRAARTAGVKPVTAPDSLQEELESREVQEAYAEQVKSDIKKRVREDPDFSSQQFPNSHRAFSDDS